MWCTNANAHDDESAALATINRQLSSMRSRGIADPVAAAQLDALEPRRWTRLAATNAASDAVDAAEQTFESSRIEHGQLSEREAALVSATAVGIADIDIGDLKDPSQLWGAIKGVVGGLWDLVAGLVVNFAQFVGALVDGDFLDALHHLSDVIGDVLFLVAVVGLIAAVCVSPGLILVAAQAISGYSMALTLAKLALDAFF